MITTLIIIIVSLYIWWWVGNKLDSSGNEGMAAAWFIVGFLVIGNFLLLMCR